MSQKASVFAEMWRIRKFQRAIGHFAVGCREGNFNVKTYVTNISYTVLELLATSKGAESWTIANLAE